MGVGVFNGAERRSFREISGDGEGGAVWRRGGDLGRRDSAATGGAVVAQRSRSRRMAERRVSTAWEWIWQMRDSVRPKTAAISARRMFSW